VCSCNQFQQCRIGSRRDLGIPDEEPHLDSPPPHLHRDQPGECEVSRIATCQFLGGAKFHAIDQNFQRVCSVKGERRYRCYVSRGLITGTASQTESGWRIPAAEIERSIATAVRMILDERTAIVADIEQHDFDAGQIKSILDAAAMS